LPTNFTPARPLRVNFCGHLHASRGIHQILALAERCESVLVDIIGNPRNDALLDQIHRTPRVRYIEPVQNSLSQELMAEADLVSSLYDPSIEVNRESCSNKTFEAMMLGRPLLTNSGINIADFVQKHSLGVIVPFGDTDATLKVIQSLLQNPPTLREMGNNGRKQFELRYGWDRESRTYLSAVSGLVGTKCH
jgi:glycosyltransferase involved in cell wall biosynthesis